jgi:hypothetical protein
VKSAYFFILASFFIALFVFPSVSPCEDKDFNDFSTSDITKIDENVYQIGNILLDGNKRQISLNGWVNMSEGLVELLACAPGGKVHESVLVIDVEPYHLQVALLLLGLEARGNLEYQGDPKTPEGDPVEIFVEWMDSTNGETKSYRAEDLVYNVKKDRPMKHTHWVFTGSQVVDSVFVAQLEKSLVTTYHDPFTILDNPLPTGADDTLYEANRFLVPPKGTGVKMIIRPYEEKNNK